jgi:hypothetical protein
MLLREFGNLLKHISLGLAIAAALFFLEIAIALVSYLPFVGSGYVPDEYEWLVATVMVFGNAIALVLIIFTAGGRESDGSKRRPKGGFEPNSSRHRVMTGGESAHLRAACCGFLRFWP